MYLLSLTNTNANANANTNTNTNTNVNTNANTESDQKQIKNNLDEKLCSKLRWLAGKRSAMCGTDHAQMLACLNTIQFSLVVPVLLKVSDESDFIFGKQRKCKWSSRDLVLKQLFNTSDFEKIKSLCYKDNDMEAPQ